MAADLVQDLYLRELKNYKPSPVRPADADEHVQKFSIPPPPPPPEQIDLAADLKAYEGQQVEVEAAAAAEAEDSSGPPDNWFEQGADEEEGSSAYQGAAAP